MTYQCLFVSRLRVRRPAELGDVGDVCDDVCLDLQVVGDHGRLDDHSRAAAADADDATTRRLESGETK